MTKRFTHALSIHTLLTLLTLLPGITQAQTLRVVSGAGSIVSNTNGSNDNVATSLDGGAFIPITNGVNTQFATSYAPSTLGGPSPSGNWQASGAGQPTYFVTSPKVTTNTQLREYITTDFDKSTHGSITGDYDLPVAGTLTTLWNPTPNPTHVNDFGVPLDQAQDISVLVPGTTPGTYRGDEWDKFFRYDVTISLPTEIGNQFFISGESRSDNSIYDIVLDYGTTGQTILSLGATTQTLPPTATALPNPYLRNNTDVPSISSFMSPNIVTTPSATHTISFITFNSHDTLCDNIQLGQVCPSPATLLFDFNIVAVLPEPTTLALAIIGIPFFLRYRRPMA
jgi:hypothetical protein